MATTAPPAPQIGRLVRRSTDPVDTRRIGLVAGLVLVQDPPPVIVRWPGARSTFEPEGTLVEAFQLRQ